MSDPAEASTVYLPYREFVTGRGIVGRPVVMAKFALEDHSVTFPMLVDTGADEVLLPRALMDAFELREESCEAVEGGTLYGRQTGWRSLAALVSFPDLWGEVLFETPVVFTPWLDDRAYGILGREPTFDHVGCQFEHREGYGFLMWISG